MQRLLMMWIGAMPFDWGPPDKDELERAPMLGTDHLEVQGVVPGFVPGTKLTELFPSLIGHAMRSNCVHRRAAREASSTPLWRLNQGSATS
jgi:hypothetical protein